MSTGRTPRLSDRRSVPVGGGGAPTSILFVFCLLVPSEGGSQGTARQTEWTGGRRRAKAPLSEGAGGQGWEDAERASCEATVCSEQGSCSPLPGRERSPASKMDGFTAAGMADKGSLYEGGAGGGVLSLRRGDQQASWIRQRPYAPTCILRPSLSSGRRTPPLNPTTRTRPHRLGFPAGGPGSPLRRC